MTDKPATTRILLVDDEALVRDELGGLLEDEGFTVTTAADGQEGLDLFRELEPDMVISDVRMPKVDGLTLVRCIRTERPDIPVTVITGHGTEAMAIDALRAGVVDFIKKPVRVDDLTAALARMQDASNSSVSGPSPLPVSAKLTEQRWSYRLRNERAAVPPFVDSLLATCAQGLARGAFTEFSLAARELILNAVEHGNLGLTYAEKSAALESGTLEGMLAERAASAPYRDRRVEVVAERSETTLTVMVRDQGDGFDWRALPDPTDPSNLLADHGRGVLLARLSVDDLRYNEAGNVVRISKQLNA